MAAPLRPRSAHRIDAAHLVEQARLKARPAAGAKAAPLTPEQALAELGARYAVADEAALLGVAVEGAAYVLELVKVVVGRPYDEAEAIDLDDPADPPACRISGAFVAVDVTAWGEGGVGEVAP